MPTLEPETQLVPVQQAPITPMTLLHMAVSRGADIDTIERLAKLQREMLEYDAKVAYGKAMQRAQESMTRVSADANNPQTHSKYASYAQLDRALRPLYSREGFSLSFDTGESPLPENVRVICNVMHSAGHTERPHIDMPADGKGAKGGDVMTKTHATGAASSYGMRYLLKMIFNVAVGEEDRDGNEPPKGNRLKDEIVVSALDDIENCRDLVELQRVHNRVCKMAQEADDKAAELAFMKASNARKVAVREGR